MNKTLERTEDLLRAGKVCKDCKINPKHLSLPRCKDCNAEFRKSKGYDKRSYRNSKVADEDVCIYAIYDNSAVYIGSTCDWTRRRIEHAYSICGKSEHKTVSSLKVEELKYRKILTAEQDPLLRDEEYRMQKERHYVISFREKYPHHNLLNVIWCTQGKEETL